MQNNPKIKLKILLISPIYGGSLPTARFTYAALKNMGHTVEFFDANRFYDGLKKIGEVTANKDDMSMLRSSYTNLLGECVIAKAKEITPDLIIALAQAPLPISVLKRLQQMHIPTAFWFVEDFRTLTYWKEVAPYYDYFFTIQKGEFHDELKKIGVKYYHYLPQGAAPSLYKKTPLSEADRKEYGSDVSFVGAGYYNRRLFFKGLVDYDFKIWGTEWVVPQPLWGKVQRDSREVSSEESIKIYNGTKININLHSSSYHEGINPDGDFINPRTFEIASCAGFQLVDSRKPLSEFFNIGEEIITFNDLYDLREKIDYYLSHQEERRIIGMKGQKRIYKEHTFEHRMSEMINKILEWTPDRFLRNNDKDANVDSLIKEAGEDTALGKYLLRFKGKGKVSLSDIVKDIENGEGNLSKTESIFLMMNQFLSEKK